MYGFLSGGEGLASQMNKFIDGKFLNQVNPKDGFAILECKDVIVKRLLEFLILILYPKKPTRVTITIGNTLLKNGKVAWQTPRQLPNGNSSIRKGIKCLNFHS